LPELLSARGNVSCVTFFHPDYTVGPGVSPDLLLSSYGRRSRALPPVGNQAPDAPSPCPEGFVYKCRKLSIITAVFYSPLL
jgi:hypothetical protein